MTIAIRASSCALCRANAAARHVGAHVNCVGPRGRPVAVPLPAALPWGIAISPIRDVQRDGHGSRRHRRGQRAHRDAAHSRAAYSTERPGQPDALPRPGTGARVHRHRLGRSVDLSNERQPGLPADRARLLRARGLHSHSGGPLVAGQAANDGDEPDRQPRGNRGRRSRRDPGLHRGGGAAQSSARQPRTAARLGPHSSGERRRAVDGRAARRRIQRAFWSR